MTPPDHRPPPERTASGQHARPVSPLQAVYAGPAVANEPARRSGRVGVTGRACRAGPVSPGRAGGASGGSRLRRVVTGCPAARGGWV